jgi:carbon storage regulator
MLVLTRKAGERIVLGKDIELEVLEICGKRVRLGFSAPSHVPIHRQEVRRRIEQERRLSAFVFADDNAVLDVQQMESANY